MANVKTGLTGAASGAAAGAALGPWGAVAGGLIGGIGGLLGGGDDEAPQSPVTPAMVAQANGNVNQQYAQQQAFLQALQAQGGLQNQTNVYNQLGGIADGTGPNPAQAMLQQQTANNVAQQAALMAGQRGAGQNAGLIARQAAQQGGALQQQAVGQGATLQAQQSLSALGQQGAIAGQQVTNQMNTQQQLAQNAIQNQGSLLGNQTQFNAPLAAQDQKFNQNLIGGLMNGAGAAVSTFAGNGSAPKIDPSTGAPNGAGKYGPAFAEGGMVQDQKENTDGMDFMHIEKFLHGGPVDGKAPVKGDSPKNDTVHALLSPGEIVLPRSVTQSADPVSGAAQFVQAILARKGR